jgi:hypothetical protein
MPDVLPFQPERADVEHAVSVIERGDMPAALTVMREKLVPGGPPTTGRDHRVTRGLKLRAVLNRGAPHATSIRYPDHHPLRPPERMQSRWPRPSGGSLSRSWTVWQEVPRSWQRASGPRSGIWARFDTEFTGDAGEGVYSSRWIGRSTGT